MAACQNCGTEQAEGARFCNHCGTAMSNAGAECGPQSIAPETLSRSADQATFGVPVESPAARVTTRRRWLIPASMIVVVLLGVATLAGWKVTSDIHTRRATAAAAEAAQARTAAGAKEAGRKVAEATKAAAVRRKNLAIGETFEYQGEKVTVRSARAALDDTGARAFLVTVKYQNTSTEAFPYSMYDWEIQTGSGVRTHSGAILGTQLVPNALGDGDLAPGGTVTGSMSFLAPDGVVKLVFSPGYSASEEDLVTWKVKSK